MLNWISKLKKKLNNNSEIKTEPQNKVFDFESLTPTNNADTNGLYCAALDEALSDENHYNVALTGGYGTGKSSIIETFLSKSKKYKTSQVIRISLANFNFRKTEEIDKRRKVIIAGRNTNENEEQIELEIGVLQQIIFQVNNKYINKTFRKKIKIGYRKPFLFSVLILITSISTVLLWYPNLLYKWISMPNLYLIIESFWFKAPIFLLTLAGTITLLSIIFHRFSELRLNKFEIKSIGANFDRKESHFSLNSHLDELIFLISKGEIKLLVFEDLDRFNDYEIFEKLREINHVLRYSPDLQDKKVKFLFVLRESIFKNENEKNKFFDLIIPVVPFISSKNSHAKMNDLFNEEIISITNHNTRELFKSVLRISALCIDEMRTIKSIYNDYLVYLKVIEKNDTNIIDLPKHELLSIVIYKNLFPLDFENINSGTSKLEQILNNRIIFLNELIKSKENQIKKPKEDVLIDNLNLELNKKNLDIENEIKNLKTASFANILSQHKKGKDILLFFNGIYNQNTNVNVNKFDENYLKSELKINLVAALILEDFINFNFKHYTSIFHKGELSFNDRSLYMKFRTGIVFNFDQHFDNPSSFISQFTPSDWNKMTYFCEELFDEILFNSEFDDQLNVIFTNGSEYHLKFLEYYIPKTKFIRKISMHIFANWSHFSVSALNFSEFRNETFDLLLPQLLLNQNQQIINNQNIQNQLSDYISSKQEITSLFPKDKERILNVKNNLGVIFESLSVKFHQISEIKNSWILDLIFEKNLYKINMQMLNLWGRIYNEDKLYVPTYSNVMNSRFSSVKKYISSNLFEFTNNVLFEIKSKEKTWIEEEEFLMDLLNKDVEINKTKIISEIDFSEFKLEDYTDEIWGPIMNNHKAKATWENLVCYFEKFGIDEYVLSIINNASWTSTLNIFNEKTSNELEIDRIVNFWESILEHKLSHNSLQKLKNNYHYYISYKIISALTNINNLEHLISIRAFFPKNSIEIYEQIKVHFSSAYLHLKFAKVYSTEILVNENNYFVFQNLNQNELIYIVRNNFSKAFFEKSIETISNLETFTFQFQESIDILKLINKYNYSTNNTLNILVLRTLPLTEQINFFKWLFDKGCLNKINLTQYIIHFKDDLKGLDRTQVKFKLNNTDNNKRFALVLKQLGLIKDFKIENSKEISFYRNQYRFS